MPFDGTPIALFDQRKCNNGLPAIGEGAQAGSYVIVEKSKNRFWAWKTMIEDSIYVVYRAIHPLVAVTSSSSTTAQPD